MNRRKPGAPFDGEEMFRFENDEESGDGKRDEYEMSTITATLLALLISPVLAFVVIVVIGYLFGAAPRESIDWFVGLFANIRM